MKKEKTIVKKDSRNRITLPKKFSSNLNQIYKIYEKKGNIILEPIQEIDDREKWLLDPKNKPILDQLKKAINQKDLINFDDFMKRLKKK
jgi:hypothetical protein